MGEWESRSKEMSVRGGVVKRGCQVCLWRDGWKGEWTGGGEWTGEVGKGGGGERRMGK